jgi:hypothetical protein
MVILITYKKCTREIAKSIPNASKYECNVNPFKMSVKMNFLFAKSSMGQRKYDKNMIMKNIIENLLQNSL